MTTSIDPESAWRLRARITRRYEARRRQLRAYFDLLLSLAEKAAPGQRDDLFDRIERVLAEMGRYRVWEVTTRRCHDR